MRNCASPHDPQGLARRRGLIRGGAWSTILTGWAWMGNRSLRQAKGFGMPSAISSGRIDDLAGAGTDLVGSGSAGVAPGGLFRVGAESGDRLSVDLERGFCTRLERLFSDSGRGVVAASLVYTLLVGWIVPSRPASCGDRPAVP